MNTYEVRPRVEAGGFLVFKRDAALPVAIVPLNHRDPVEVRAAADAIAAALTLVDKGEPVAQVADADRLEWLERNTNLHGGVELTYVVDGYEAQLTLDCEPIGKAHHGKTLRDAIDKAMLG